MRASVDLVGRARVVFAIFAAALVCAGSASAAPSWTAGHDRRLRRDAARVRIHHPRRHRPGRRLARRHPLPRARPVAHRHGAVRQRARAVRLRRPRLRRPRHGRLGRQVRARRADRGAGRAGSLQLVRRAQRRLGHEHRGPGPLARRRQRLERCGRRRPVQGDRAGDTWTDLGQALNPQRRAEDRVAGRAPPGRACGELGPSLNPVQHYLLRRHRERGGKSVEAARSSRSKLHSLHVPTLLLQGRHDFLFDIDQAVAAYKLLAGPKRLYLGDIGHAPAKNPTAEEPTYLNEVLGWFDEYLAGGPKASGGVDLAHDPWDGTTSHYKSLPTHAAQEREPPRHEDAQDDQQRSQRHHPLRAPHGRPVRDLRRRLPHGSLLGPGQLRLG